MSGIRVSLFGVVLASIVAACTLIDPLDGISDGPPAARNDAGKKDGATASSSGGTSSSGATDDDDDAATSSSGGTTSSSGNTTFFCNGVKEVEPNETNATPLTGPLSCGAISGPGDIDRWSFKNNSADTLQIFAKVVASSPLHVSLQSPSGSSSSTSGSSILSSLEPGETLTIQITTLNGELGEVAYRIEFAAN